MQRRCAQQEDRPRWWLLHRLEQCVARRLGQPVGVLDDALSHVDTHTEEEILSRLRGFMAERTTILIAHRTSTLTAADFIVDNGPETEQERWENQSGWSPNTIATEIAGLITAADIARKHGATAKAAAYEAKADEWQAKVESWTATTTGPYSPKPYYLRVTKPVAEGQGPDPDVGTTYGLGDNRPEQGQAAVDDSMHVLGVAVLRECGEADQVSEQHRRVPPLRLRDVRADRRTTRGADLCVGRAGGSAVRTSHRAPPVPKTERGAGRE